MGEDTQWVLGQRADTLPGPKSFQTPQRSASAILRPLHLPVRRAMVGSACLRLCQLKRTPDRKVQEWRPARAGGQGEKEPLKQANSAYGTVILFSHVPGQPVGDMIQFAEKLLPLQYK